MQKQLLLTTREQQPLGPLWLLCTIALLPCLSVLSAYYVSHVGLLLVYLLAGMMIFISLFKVRQDFADRYFPLMLSSVALSLLLSSTLISENLSGYDIHLEYLLFQGVLQSGSWAPNLAVTYNAALSVTILPSVISLITSLDGVTILKTVYPALYSIVPMILYSIYRRILSPRGALLSVFVFLTYPASYLEITQLARQIVAELFLVLLLLLLLSGPLKEDRPVKLLVIVLTTGLVISHYSMGIIYCYVIGVSYAISRLNNLRSRKLTVAGLTSSTLMAYSLVTAGAWYFFVASGIVFRQVSLMASFVVQGMADFFNPTSRPYHVVDALAVSKVNVGIFHLANRFTQYLVVGCIILGFALYLLKRPKSHAESALTGPIIACIVFIFAGVVFPYFSSSLNLSRIYQISLIFISPLLYVGAMKITSGLKWVSRFMTPSHRPVRMGTLLPVALLFCYLLLTSGWVWAVTSDSPTSVVLDGKRMVNSSDPQVMFSYYNYYTLSQDVAATNWIGTYAVPGHLLCADANSLTAVLRSYGGLGGNQSGQLPFCKPQQYVFLSVVNTVTNNIEYEQTKYGSLGVVHFNVTSTDMIYENRVFSDGASIYEQFT